MRAKRGAPILKPAPSALPPLRGGAYTGLLIVASLCVLAAVTYKIYDPDLWQHLTVGREIWRTHTIPHTQMWSWPTHGAPDVVPSWLFRVLLWPFWEAGGVHGVFVWRWLTLLVTFAFLLAATRRSGATGAVAVLALVWCALLWRQRSQARPETFGAILLAADLWLLEARRAALRAGRPTRHAWGIVLVAWIWANAHISYYLGLAIAAGYLLDDLRSGRTRPARDLARAIVAAAAISFANPFGWRILAQPFEYFFGWRHEPIYISIGELNPVDWGLNLRNGLPLFLALLVMGAIVRARRRGPDWAEIVVLLVCLPQALTTQRFVGYFAVCVAPFFARDLQEMASTIRWPKALRAPGPRAAIAALACVALVVPELSRPLVGFGYGMVWNQYPVRACDWIEKHDVRGRSFNPFSYGGYLLWRFYPDSTRLPFMDIHQAGTKEIRYIYAWAGSNSSAWHLLDRRYRFDWVITMSGRSNQVGLLDFLDADSTWALVFADDAAALYLRRNGRCAPQARELAYQWMPAGFRRAGQLGQLAWKDSTLRRAIGSDLERAMAASEWNGRAHSMAANLALQEGRWGDAAAHLRHSIAVGVDEPRLHARLGTALLYGGDPNAALRQFDAERGVDRTWAQYDLRRGQALEALGRTADARAAYERAVRRNPGDAEARDSLAALGQR